MFRFENSLPKCFVDESRDFQLMARLDDTLFMGQRADIATMTNVNHPTKCKNIFLDLLAKKVGFFTREYLDDDVLRAIIGAFQTTLKYKGTKKGIEMAVKTILKCENSIGEPIVNIISNFDESTGLDHYVQILTPVDLVHKVALREFLKYILPFGYIYILRVYKEPESDLLTNVSYKNTVNVFKSSAYNLGTIRTDNQNIISDDIDYDASLSESENKIEQQASHLLGTYDLGLIVDNPNLDDADLDNVSEPDFSDYLDLSKDPSKKTIEKIFSTEQQLSN